MKLTCNKNNPPLGGVITAEYVNSQVKSTESITINWDNETVFELNTSKIACDSSNDVMRLIARALHQFELYGLNVGERTEIDHWLTFSVNPLSSRSGFSDAVLQLNKVLGPLTYLVAKHVTIADLAVFLALYLNKQWQGMLSKKDVPVNVLRWYNYIKSRDYVKKTLDLLPPEVTVTATSSSNRQSLDRTTGGRAQEGKFIDLPGAEMGKVVVRFPPEASGYLHIGHAKAALLNQYYQQAFEGKLIMRFDDTNPAKENVHFEKVILEDIEMLEIKPDMFTHTSEYFDVMLEYCEKLLKEGKAYVDDTDPELMKQQREQKVESVNRNNAYEKNYELWQEMKKGTAKGQKCCVRAKIDMQSPNGCMRDPTIYRCKNEPHPRTGEQYKVYPTYDFACPIVDAIENVTHTLRTMEYHDRDAQFYWFIEALNLRKPYIWEYSRLSMTNTVLSKRKLTWFVENNLVDAWDDPRFPTVRGVLRRGMTVEGLKQFIIAQGSSRSVVFMEWDKIWAFNKKVIDPIAPRYTAVEFDSPVPVLVKNAVEEKLIVAKHPKNPDVGNKEMWIGPRILIDRADAECLKAGENTTFINWGNLLINKINRVNGKIMSVEAETNLDNKDYKKTLKLTWLAETNKAEFTPTWCVYFDHIISKPLLGKDEDFKQYVGHNTRTDVQMLGDPELRKLKKGDIIQLQRRGFFKVDVAYEPTNLHTCREGPIVLFSIPDGHTKENPTSGAAKASTPQVQVPDSKKVARTPQIINDEIVKQGDIVRNLKSQKAAKGEIDSAVKLLLDLKAEFKLIANNDWKPGCISTASSQNAPAGGDADLNSKIILQGDKVRQLKAEKSDKSVIEPEVKLLLSLKNDYKKLTGKDWTPNLAKEAINSAKEAVNSAKEAIKCEGLSEAQILSNITKQGDKIRKLKEEKAGKPVVEAEVKVLLDLKAQFKSLTGKDWKPGMQAEENTVAAKMDSVCANNASIDVSNIVNKINEQGDCVRKLKASNASKSEIDEAVKVLLNLKNEYKTTTGSDFPTTSSKSSKPAKAKDDKSKEKTAKKPVVKEKPSVDAEEGGVKKQTRLGLESKKEENLSEWYSQVITKGELIEYYDVSGCYIYRPWSYAIWEVIKDWFDAEIKKLGVQNCYFPMFVSRSALEREKTHIADFAPEVAWVTKSGDSELAEPIAVRPTSETVMYPAYAKWIQSYRDLPLLLNQWNNVVRWEFKHPQPFLRTREFLWQEGHTAHATQKGAADEVQTILNLYAKIYTDLLAVPVIKGRKTKKEQFAGSDYSYTVEAFVKASGRGIQGATSHHLGQNFSKMFEIVFEDPETQEKQYVYQNSWGITTRSIGVMIMVHGDNQGLVVPPKVASVQVVIVPCGITAGLAEADRLQLVSACNALENELKEVGVRVVGDHRTNYSPGWKFNHWELKGVPIRVELGPKDVKNKQLIAVRRDTGEKITVKRDTAVKDLRTLLDTIQANLYNVALKDLETHIVRIKDWSQFTPMLDKKNILLVPFCGDGNCEDKIKADSTRDEAAEPGAPSMGAKSLCIPTDQPEPIKPTDKCIHPACKNKPQYYTLFGRSY